MFSYEQCMELCKKILEQDEYFINIPDIQRAFKSISDILETPPMAQWEIDYIHKVNESTLKSDRIVRLYLPKYRMEIKPEYQNLWGIIKAFKNRELVELVNKYLPQKTAMRAVLTDPQQLNNMLKLFLNASKINSDIIMTENNDTYEFILRDNMVNNSEERLQFVNRFKDFLINLNLNELAESIISDLHHITDFPDCEEWKSINHTPEYNFSNDYVIGKIKEDSINSATIIINNYGIIGNNNVMKIITKDDFSKTYQGFVEYITATKPEWYPSEGGWVDIDTLYDNYKEFGLSKTKNHFASKLKDILWIEKIRGTSRENRTKYYCKKL